MIALLLFVPFQFLAAANFNIFCSQPSENGNVQVMQFEESLKLDNPDSIHSIQEKYAVSENKGNLQPEAATGYQEKTIVIANEMMVASANDFASQTGYKILKAGGNAIDAAAAMAMVLNVVEPQSSGIGGGAFLLYYRKRDNQVIAYDGREVAPRAIKANHFLDMASKPIPLQDAIIGGHSVGVPGLLKLLELVHQEEGNLPWSHLLQDAIDLSEKGFPISPRLHQLIADTPDLKTFTETARFLFLEDGTPKPAGMILKNPELGQTLREIAEGGASQFYSGEIAQSIVNTVNNASKNPGQMSLNDLAEYHAIKRQPIQFKYGDYLVFSVPPPSSGGIAIGQILKMLEFKGFRGLDFGSAQFINLFCQASCMAFADRNFYIGDPAFVKVPIVRLLDPGYLKFRSHLIRSKKTIQHPQPGRWPDLGIIPLSTAFDLVSTSHICVVDSEGNAVSMTTSIENAFGSTLMTQGFFLNNQLTDFSFLPKGANKIKPGKRPMSAMSPTFVFDGKTNNLTLVLGSAGGARIIDYVAQAILGVLSFDLNVQESVDFPHFTSYLDGVELEKDTFLEREANTLRKMGNNVSIIELNSGTQGIQRIGQHLVGGIDPRREGAAIGE